MGQGLDIPAIFNAIFGTKPVQIDAGNMFVRKEVSDLGAPFYHSDPERYNGREWFLPIEIDGKQLPLPSMRSDDERIIVKRKLKSQDGFLKSNLGKGDVKYVINGLCLSEDGQYPEEDVTLINELHAKGISLPINSVLTAIQDVELVVIENVRWLPNKGFKGVVPYQMELSSDKEYELIVTNV